MPSDTLEEINLPVVFCPRLLDSSVDPLAISQGNMILQGSFHDLFCHHLKQPLVVISRLIRKLHIHQEVEKKGECTIFLSLNLFPTHVLPESSNTFLYSKTGQTATFQLMITCRPQHALPASYQQSMLQLAVLQENRLPMSVLKDHMV